MSNKTRKLYKGGDPPEEWMSYNPEAVAGKLGDYNVIRENILEAIEENERASECIKLFSRTSYNLLVGVYNYWKILKQKKSRGILNTYIDNPNLMNILEYVDLDNFPDNFETFCCYKFILQASEKGNCVDPGKTFEVDVFPPEATLDFYQGQFTQVEAERQRNIWVTQQVKDILLGNAKGEIGNTRELFYLLNELFHSDCPSKKSPYYKKRYSVMNIFWTLIWCRAIVNTQETMKYITSKSHLKLINKHLFNDRTKINVSEIDDRINMLITIYGAKDIFQIITIPDGDYNDPNFKAVSRGGNAKLSIITGDFESKINICHMGRPKVIPHIALSKVLNPKYRAVPTGEPVIVMRNDGKPIIKQSDQVYIDEIKKLQNEFREAKIRGNSGDLTRIIKKFNSLGTFKDKNGLEWVSCISPCICMTIDKGVTQSCSKTNASCNSTGNYLALPQRERISRPNVGGVKHPVLSNRELRFLFSEAINKYKINRAAQIRVDPNSIELSNQELRKILRFKAVPWEIGQWFIRVNPKSTSYKVAQQNQSLVTTGISNHARLLMDYFSLFIPFTDYNNKQLLTARLVSSLIQPVHHTFNEVMRSVEYLGINYDPLLPEVSSVNRLLKEENEEKIRELKKLFGTISYQTIVPYLNQNQYDNLYRNPNDLGIIGDKFTSLEGLYDDASDFSREYIYPSLESVYSEIKPLYPEGLRRRRVPSSTKGGKTRKRKNIKKRTRKKRT